MNSRQSFWLDINWVEPTTDTTPNVTPDNTTESKDVLVSATVLSNESTYKVTVPSEIGFGELSVDGNTVVNYEVSVSNFVKGNDGELTDGTNTIAFANSFGTEQTNENATFNGMENCCKMIVLLFYKVLRFGFVCQLYQAFSLFL